MVIIIIMFSQSIIFMVFNKFMILKLSKCDE